MLAVKRPGTGIAPARLDDVVGKRALRNIGLDETLTWDDVQ
jgi:N-acetylneuraminate synthase